MPTSSEITIHTIFVSSLVLLLLGSSIIYILFLYQRKRFRHQQELFEMKEAFGQTLMHSKLAIQEQTLDHIAKELHANFSHLVSLININLQEILPQTQSNTRESVLETKSLAKQLMGEIKALSASLNTDHIMHIGLTQALDNELTRLNKKFQVTVTKTGEEYRLKPEHEIILFRLCQEVLNNVIKYSEASRILVTLSFAPDNFTLSITDDGSGFNVEEALGSSGTKQSTGLINMRKRASVINAGFHISSSPGAGTTVTINIPDPEKINTLAA
jgi:signal transduction histidine kinase